MLTSLLKEEIEKINPRDKEKRTWMELVVLATIKLAIKGHPAVFAKFGTVWMAKFDRMSALKWTLTTKSSRVSTQRGSGWHA
jgi:hypothetical protein